MAWEPWETDRQWYPPSRPRPADGIRAQTARGPFGKSWWAGRWVAALERLVDPGRLRRGRSYARSGQVVKLAVGRDGVRASVQGSRKSPYRVDIRFAPLSESAWERAIVEMASEAMYTARLLAGEMPEQIEEVFERVGASLFPSQRGDLVSECSCPDWANPCKHVAAVHYLLGERFDADPFLIFLLRGRSRDEILAEIRARRAMAAGESAPDGPDVPEPAVGESVVETPSAFWSMPSLPLGDIGSMEPPDIDALPIKRLGAPTFWHGPGDLTAFMEEAYRAVAAEASRLAHEDPATPPGSPSERPVD